MTLIDKAEALAPCPFCGGGVSVTTTERVGGIVCDAPSECIGSGLLIVFDLEDMETALAAWNRRAIPARGVGVKPLQWKGPRKLDEGGAAYDAHTTCGQYIATDTGWFLVGRSGWLVATSLAAAKAAAQADYEARILAALSPAPDAREAAQVIAKNGAEATAAAMILHIAETLRAKGKAVLTTGDDFGAQVLQYADAISEART